MKENSPVYFAFFKVFDVGEEVDIEMASRLLIQNNPDKFKLKKYSKELILYDAPLVVNLGSFTYQLKGEDLDIVCLAKIWSYGAISVTLKTKKIFQAMSEITPMVTELENEKQFHDIILQRVEELTNNIHDSIKIRKVWNQYEDYTIISFPVESFEISSFNNDELFNLVEGSSNLKFSNQTKSFFKQNTFQYSENDLLLMDWNRSIMIGEREEMDEISDILEFALCQLLELRYYDDILTNKLNALYSSVENQKSHLFRNKYASLSEESALLYIEFSDVIDKIGNSLKVVGDTFYAKIYRSALDRFGVGDWKNSVSAKLQSLASLSNLFSSETNEKRNQLMELTIILLIAIEVIPYVYNLFQ